MKNIKLGAALALFVVFISQVAQADEKRHYNQSISLQIGENGTLQDGQYSLAFVPPDVSYSHELFDNDIVNISTATTYDNIGVKIQGANFSYRIGQRVDFGLELGKYTPYITIGMASIRGGHHYQTSPVYGSGFLVRIAKRFLWVNELNFQSVHYQQKDYDIVNLSTGLIYAF